MTDCIIVRHAEIWLKGKNKYKFENQLVKNIQAFLKHEKIKHKSVRKIGSRIIIFECDDTSVKDIPGVSSVSPALLIQSVKKLENIQDKILDYAKPFLKDKSFKVNCLRSNKQFPIKSPEVCRIIGGHIAEQTGNAVSMKEYEVSVNIEIIGMDFYVYIEKIAGVGGLPAGMTGKVISMISGGIDSPVSSFLMMKRGCRLVYVHFSSYPQTTKETENKVKKLVKILDKHQLKSKLYIVPFLKLQKKIVMNIKTDLGVIFYRKIMFRICKKIMEKEKAVAITTGDNLAQVASQTLGNLLATEHSTDAFVLRPLLTYDKKEIIDVARKINTYDISKTPFDDCCTLFLPKHPETNAKMEEIEHFEKVLDEAGIEEDIDKAISDAEVVQVE